MSSDVTDTLQPACLFYKGNTLANADKVKKKKKNKRKYSASQKVEPELVKKQKFHAAVEHRNVRTGLFFQEGNKSQNVIREKLVQRKRKQKSNPVRSTPSLKTGDQQKCVNKDHFQNFKIDINQFVPSDNPQKDSQELLKWMISPVALESFFDIYWEQKVLHIKRANRNYYMHIFNSSELDKILRNHQLFYTKNVDVVNYEQGIKNIFNQEGKAIPSAVWDYYSNGCSIRLLNPQTYSHRLQLLLATLQEYFGSMVGANVYLTPPNSQGFAPHYDDIEAFIIQLEGRKHWKLYQAKGADVLARYSSPNLKHEDIGDPFMELTLNAGELLYFPRGTIHEGCTDADSHSLHVTVSVYQQTSFADLLQNMLPNALKKAAENDVEFRKGLPLDFLKHFGVVSLQNTQFKKLIQTKIENLVLSMVNHMDIDNAADMLGRKFMYDSMPPILSKDEAKRSCKADGPYLKNGTVINRVEIRLDTKIRLLRYYCVRLLLEDNSDPKLYYNTENATVYHGEEEQWLELESSMVPAIQMLQREYPCYTEVDKLPMESKTLKLQLIADLWEHGIVVTEYPLDTTDN